MVVNQGTIWDALDGRKQFIVPAYQRSYQWTEGDCDRLWNDMIEMVREDRPVHFIGSIVCTDQPGPSTGVKKYVVIDGQQRLTTVMLILLALRDYIAQHNEESDFNLEIIKNQIVNQNVDGNIKYKLLPSKPDRAVMLDIIDRGQSDAGAHQIRTNYDFFSRKLSEKGAPSPATVADGIGRLAFVDIVLEKRDDDPQSIFECLNSTGVDLTQTDLVRNYILMNLAPEEQDEIYTQSWHPMEQLFTNEKKRQEQMDNFLGTYLTTKTGVIPKKGDIYKAFKKYAGTRIVDENISKADLAKELYKYAKNYTDITYARSDDPDIVRLYEDIKALKMDPAQSLLLRIHVDKEDAPDQISESDFKELLQMIVAYVLRRGICGLPSHSHRSVFSGALEAINDDDYANSLKAYFVQLKKTYRLPDDVEFSEALRARDIFTTKNCQFLLSHLEQFDNKTPFSPDGFTIEHIMPQNSALSDEWKAELGDNWEEVHATLLHTLGNLTFTAYNSELSDRPFAEKLTMKGGLQQTGLRLNEDVINAEHWDANAIKSRGAKLAEKALQIWAYPAIDEDALQPYMKKNTQAEYNMESYKPKKEIRALAEQLISRISDAFPDLRPKYNKNFIAFRYMDVTPVYSVTVQKKGLKVHLNADYADIDDPYDMTRDVKGLGHTGYGNVELEVRANTDLDKVLELVKQAYDLQMDNDQSDDDQPDDQSDDD